MIEINSFGVLGGDQRQASMAESMAADGYPVLCAGLEHVKGKNLKKAGWQEALKADYIILPLPVTKDGVTLNAPYAATELLLDREFFEMLKGKKVFCGMKNTLLKAGDYFKELTLLDYSKREEFAVRNAVPTAEGALEIAMGEYDGMIAGSRCLVTGFGRIGKVLSGMLKGMGARVTVSARKPEDLAWIEIYGYTPVSTGKLSEHQGFDFIFNTVPTMIFDAYTLAKTAQGAILIDLASLPGGAECRDAQEKARPGEVGLSFSFH